MLPESAPDPKISFSDSNHFSMINLRSDFSTKRLLIIRHVSLFPSGGKSCFKQIYWENGIIVQTIVAKSSYF